MNARSSIASEFETPEQAAAYEKWLTDKVAASLADAREPVAHDEAMRRVRQTIGGKSGPKKAC